MDGALYPKHRLLQAWRLSVSHAADAQGGSSIQDKADSSFQDALNPYRFDKKLRLFLFNDIKKVEIALRSALTNIVTKKPAISSG